MAVIEEKTEKEVIDLAEKFIKSGKIISYEKPEKYISHYSRNTREPIYKYRSIVIESI